MLLDTYCEHFRDDFALTITTERDGVQKLARLLDVCGQVGLKLSSDLRLLAKILEKGEVADTVVSSFPGIGFRRQDLFVSLLYYFGLLTFAGDQHGYTRLCIPNQMAETLLHRHLREASGGRF